jgi:hypothetical protein
VNCTGELQPSAFFASKVKLKIPGRMAGPFSSPLVEKVMPAGGTGEMRHSVGESVAAAVNEKSCHWATDSTLCVEEITGIAISLCLASTETVFL